MSMPERRRAPRHATDWVARYRFDPETAWRSCRVIDASVDGAAVELHNVDPHDPTAGPFHLQISSVTGDEAGVTIQASIRSGARLENGRHPVVGIEFAPLRDGERDILRLLVGLRTSV